MKHLILTISSEADLIPGDAERHPLSKQLILDDFDDIEYLGNLPAPPANTDFIIAKSPVPAEIRDDWNQRPSGWWYSARVKAARFEDNLAIATYED